MLPLRPGARVYSEGMDPAAITAAGLEPVERPENAGVAVVRVAAPYDFRDEYMLESSFHAGTLEFDGEAVAKVRKLAEAAPVVVIPHLDRPAVLTPRPDVPGDTKDPLYECGFGLDL